MDIYQALIEGGGDPAEMAKVLRRRSDLGTLGAMSGVKQLQQVGGGLQQDAETQVRGLAQARQQQDLQRLRNEGKGAGGGTTGILQVANRIQQETGMPFEQALDQAAYSMRNNYSVKDIAGVQNLVGSVTGSTTPLTSIDEVAGNAAVEAAGAAEGTVAGKRDAERFYDAPGVKARMESLMEANTRVANKARRIVDDPALGKVTGIMAYFPSIYGGQAADVEAVIESLEVEQAFQTLQAMKEASPTGGAVGQVSDYEQKMLREALTSLRRSQSKGQFARHLEEIISRMEGMNARLQKAYDEDFGVGRSLRPQGTVLPKATGRGRPPTDDILEALKAMEQ